MSRFSDVWARNGPRLASFYLSRIMGTSVTQIDATYGHLVPDSEEYLWAARRLRLERRGGGRSTLAVTVEE